MAVKQRLDRAAVVHTAARLSDELGEEASLTQLAAHLQVRVPSLYNHVAGQEGLRRELALLGARELRTRVGTVAMGKQGDDALWAFAHAYRTFAHERPALYTAALRAPAPDDAEHIQVADDLLMVLRAVFGAYDLDDDDLIHTIRAFRSSLHGFVALEAAGGFGIPLDLDTSYAHLIGAFIRGLSRS